MKNFALIDVAVFGGIAIMIIGLCLTVYDSYLGSHVTSGVVTSKTFIPEHVEVNTIMIDTDGDGIGNFPMTNDVHYPDQYRVTIRGKYGDKEYSRMVSVDKTSYQLITIGMQLDINNLPLSPKAEMEE